MAGIWEGTEGADQHPVADGTEARPFVERYELQPIDRQTNGPQLFYGLRYHTHIVKPGEAETFHDQVGYWLWEPAAETVTLTLGIPRGQVAAGRRGRRAADATEFEVRAALGSEVYGILSNPFLEQAFRTLSYRMPRQASTPATPGRTRRRGSWTSRIGTSPSRHIDRNTLTRVGPPTPNPLAQAAINDGSLGRSPGGSPGGGLGIGNLRSESRMLP